MPGRGRSPALLRETSMKKKVKKLVLAKETVRKLEATTLIEVVAGFSPVNQFCQPGDTDINATNCDC